MQSYEVMRGGSWDWDASFARCAFRSNVSPEGGRYDVGLRIVRTAD